MRVHRYLWMLGCLCLAQTDAAALEVGDEAPALELEGLLQAPDDADLSWEVLQGQAVVLEFWSTDCGPCLTALPHLNELAQTIRDEGEPVQFIAITYEEQEVIEAFLEDTSIDGWIGMDTDNSVIEAYDVPGIPRTILVDPRGRIAGITGPWTLEMAHLRRLAAGEEPELPAARRGMSVMAGLDVGEEGEVQERFDLLDAKHPGMSMISSGRDRATLKGVTAERMVAWAHGIQDSRVECRADLPAGSFDLIAAAPDDEQGFRSRVQDLVAATFEVSARVETRRMRVHVLKLGWRSESRLEPSAETSGGSASIGSYRIVLERRPVGSLVRQLENKLEQPVFDETGLDERYDFDLLWNDSFPMAIVGELRSKYGLRLVSERRDVRVLVIE